MTFEPLVGVTLAGLLLGEQPVPLQLVGGAAVVVAAVRAPNNAGSGPARERGAARLAARGAGRFSSAGRLRAAAAR